MRKILLSLIAITTICTNVWGAVTASYNSTTKTLTISGSGAMTDYTESNKDNHWKNGNTNITTSIQIVVIEEGVTTIGEYAFYNCTSLTTIYIPTSIETSKARAFQGCTVLHYVHYAGSPDQWAAINFTVTAGYCYGHPFIGSSTPRNFFFYGNESTSQVIVFAPGIETINPYAFYKASNIQSVNIPNSVTTIGQHAFDCSISYNVTINNTTPPETGTNAFTFSNSNYYSGTKRNLYVPSGAEGNYNFKPWYDDGGTDGADLITPQNLTGSLSEASSISYGLDADGVLTINATSSTKTISFDVAGNDVPWGYFRRLVHKVKLQGEITEIGNLLRYHYGLSEIIVDQNTIPTCSGKIASTTDGPSYGALFDPRSSTKLKLTIRSASLGDDSADNLGDAPWSDDKWDIQLSGNVVFSDGVDNSTLISNLQTYFAGKTFTLQLGRTLIVDGDQYNTFCSPIDLTKAQLNDADIRALESSSLDGEDLTLTFSDPRDAIEAGKPYLVRPTTETLSNPTFENITPSSLVSATTNTETNFVDFIGVLAPTLLTGGNKNTLFLGAGNELFWPEVNGNIGGMRAYFSVKGAAQKNGIRARIVMNKEVATGIEDVRSESAGAVRSEKILRNGQIIIIRDGKEYNVMGIMIK